MFTFEQVWLEWNGKLLWNFHFIDFEPGDYIGVLLTITIETSSVQGAGELCQCVSKLIGRAVDILQTWGLELEY